MDVDLQMRLIMKWSKMQDGLTSFTRGARPGRPGQKVVAAIGYNDAIFAEGKSRQILAISGY
jgi:hypothetical protein